MLVALFRADRRARERSESGKADRFAWHSTGGMGPTLLLHRGAEEDQEVDPAEIEVLIASGLLARVGQRSAVFTAEGAQLAAALDRQRTQALAVDPSWDAMKPVLEAAWREWLAAGAPSGGVSSGDLARSLGDDRERVDQQLALLERGGWVALAYAGDPRDASGLSYHPTAASMQLLGGWPSADSTIARQFLAAIEEAGETVEDDDEKTRLQELRDAAARVGESTLAAVLAKLATGGLSHL